MPQPVPPGNPDEIARMEAARFLADVPCAMLSGDVQHDAVRITGLGNKSAIDMIQRKFAGAQARITQVDPGYCGWFNLLRPDAGVFGAAGPRVGLRLAGDPPWLVKDDYIRPRVTMPDFRGELHVDYIDRGGQVLHLYPQPADPKLHVAGDPPRVFQPGEVLALGERDKTHKGWQVDEPFGTDVIIAIASEDALFDRPRPANIEASDIYARDLRQALDAIKAKGTRLIATAIPVETRRK